VEAGDAVEDLRLDVVHRGVSLELGAIVLGGRLLELLEGGEHAGAEVRLVAVPAHLDRVALDHQLVTNRVERGLQLPGPVFESHEGGRSHVLAEVIDQPAEAARGRLRVRQRSGEPSNRCAVARNGVEEPALRLVSVVGGGLLGEALSHVPHACSEVDDDAHHVLALKVPHDLVTVRDRLGVAERSVEVGLEAVLLLGGRDAGHHLVERQVHEVLGRRPRRAAARVIRRRSVEDAVEPHLLTPPRVVAGCAWQPAR